MTSLLGLSDHTLNHVLWIHCSSQSRLQSLLYIPENDLDTEQILGLTSNIIGCLLYHPKESGEMEWLLRRAHLQRVSCNEIRKLTSINIMKIGGRATYTTYLACECSDRSHVKAGVLCSVIVVRDERTCGLHYIVGASNQFPIS